MPTLEAQQIEMEILPETEFGKACKRFLSIETKIKDLKETLREAGKEVKVFLVKKETNCVRYEATELYIPEEKESTVKSRPAKGKPEALKKAA